MASVLDRLFIAAASGSKGAVNKAFREYDQKLHQVTDDDVRTLLHYACLYNSEDVAIHVLTAIKDPKDWNIGDKYDAYPYMYAARRGFHKFLKRWSGLTSLDAEDLQGRKGLHYCCGGGPDGTACIADVKVPKSTPDSADVIKCAEILVQYYVGTNQKDHNGKAPLQCAVENSNDAMLPWLMSKDAVVPKPSKGDVWILPLKFRYPDCLAATVDECLTTVAPGDFESHKLLCKASDLTVGITFKKAQQSVVSQNEYRIKCAEAIYKYLGKLVFKPKRSAFRSAMNTGFNEMIDFFVQKQAKFVLDKDQGTYQPVLHWFIHRLFEENNKDLLKDRVAKFEKFVEKFKLDVNSTDDRGMSPLHQLCGDTYETEPRTWFSLRVALVEKLLTLQADMNMEDARGRTPLILAVQTRRADVILSLLTSGADPHKTNKWGDTAVSLANDREISALLQEKSKNHSKELSNQPNKPQRT